MVSPSYTFSGQGCGEWEEFCEYTEDYPEEDIRKTITDKTSSVEREVLFSSLEPGEKSLVRERVESGEDGAVQLKAASDKLESNLINETPLCDYTESFVYPRRDSVSSRSVSSLNYLFMKLFS